MKLKCSVSARILAISVTALFSVPACASLVTDNFVFTNNSAVVANGSFSYDSSHSGQLTYADLSSFAVNLVLPAGKQSYNLAFALAHTNYNYFGYNTNLNTFVPSSVSGSEGPYPGILSAINNRNLTDGFFFDPLPSQSNLGVPGSNDGVFAGYAPYSTNTATAFSVTPVPEPPAGILMGSGIGLLWGVVGFRKRKGDSQQSVS
ncbi:MAG: PEP-CTERM sorting domain-containing protein [Acidiferrobacteraceae bacterium]